MNIAFIGRLGSGKSTAARILEQDGWVRHSWAEPVRAIFAMAYDGDVTGPGYAETKKREYLVKTHEGHRVVTGRHLLQLIGTEAMRESVDLDFWLKAGLRNIDDRPTVNDDTRFLNEADALRERGFKLVRIVRPGFDQASTHASETEQDRIAVDYTIQNDASIESLGLKVRYLVHSMTPQVMQVGRPEPVSHEVVSEEWGYGWFNTDKDLLGFITGTVENRGEWPPDTRVAGRLTCCGATEHTLDCPQWR